MSAIIVCPQIPRNPNTQAMFSIRNAVDKLVNRCKRGGESPAILKSTAITSSVVLGELSAHGKAKLFLFYGEITNPAGSPGGTWCGSDNLPILDMHNPTHMNLLEGKTVCVFATGRASNNLWIECKRTGVKAYVGFKGDFRLPSERIFYEYPSIELFMHLTLISIPIKICRKRWNGSARRAVDYVKMTLCGRLLVITVDNLLQNQGVRSCRVVPGVVFRQIATLVQDLKFMLFAEE